MINTKWLKYWTEVTSEYFSTNGKKLARSRLASVLPHPQKSCLLASAPPSSPWAEIGIGNKKVVINAPYRESSSGNSDTVYIAGLESVYNPLHVTDFIKEFLLTTTTIVDPGGSTAGEGAISCRFLKDRPSSIYTTGKLILAISTANSATLSSLKKGVVNMGGCSNQKYTLSQNHLNQLHLVAEVFSVVKEDTD